MKTRYIFMFVLATMAMVACEKENPNAGKLQLVAEGMGGNTKLAINGNSSYWVDGERVNINGTEYAITVNSGSAYVDEDVSVTAPYLGVYPAGIINSISGHSYTLTLPAEYTYATTTYNSQTMQNLASPMVAYANGGNQLYFKHVTAAVNVQVINYHYDYDIVVDSIEVSSNNYKLNGSVVINMENVAADDFVVDAQSGSTDAEKKVKMKFGSGLLVASGNSTMVQVPVLPVAADNKFTVKIAVHRADQTSVTAILSRTQTTGGALARAYAGYALYTLGGPFTVNSDGKKVIFSKGNLQYHPKNKAWQFAPNQYDAIGADNENIADDYDGWIDLFGWGTGDVPTKKTTTVGDYSSYNEWGANISSEWYTLEKDEWLWLLGPSTGTITPGTNCRATTTFGLLGTDKDNARFVLSMIDNINGMIIFPDNYCHPADATVSYNNAAHNAKVSYNKFRVSAENWKKMQIAGAVFLPAGGWRKGSGESSVNDINSYGLYWSKTSYSDNNCYTMYFMSGNFNPIKNYSASSKFDTYRYCGQSVRLVRDVQ